jgi:hypothetical protein
VAFVGNDGEALFERPKAASEVYDRNPLLIWGDWWLGGMTLRGQEAPGVGFIHVLITTSLIETQPGGCRSRAWYYEQRGDRLTVRNGPGSGCEGDDGSDEVPMGEILAGGVKIERSSPTERLLVGAVGTIRLVRRLGECAGTDETRCYLPLGR